MEKIILPQGSEIDLDKSSNTEIVLKKMEEKKMHNYFDIALNGDIDKTFLTITSTDSQSEKIRAISQLHILAEYYNRVHAWGWKPDFYNQKQAKFYARWSLLRDELESISLVSVSTSEPVWASYELIQLAYMHNKGIFEKALKP